MLALLYRVLPFPGLCLLFAAIVGASAREAAPAATITCRRGDDRVEVGATERATIFSVTSPFGISGATLSRTGPEWPRSRELILRLHLKGLSKFEATDGAVKIEASVSFLNNRAAVRVWKDRKEDELLDAGSAYWLDIRILNSDESPVTEAPLTSGWFEVRLPKALFAANPSSIKVSWIDFYRE